MYSIIYILTKLQPTKFILRHTTSYRKIAHINLLDVQPPAYLKRLILF